MYLIQEHRPDLISPDVSVSKPPTKKYRPRPPPSESAGRKDMLYQEMCKDAIMVCCFI